MGNSQMKSKKEIISERLRKRNIHVEIIKEDLQNISQKDLKDLPEELENIIKQHVYGLQHKEKFEDILYELKCKTEIIPSFDLEEVSDEYFHQDLDAWVLQDMAEEAYYDYHLYATDSDL